MEEIEYVAEIKCEHTEQESCMDSFRTVFRKTMVRADLCQPEPIKSLRNSVMSPVSNKEGTC